MLESVSGVGRQDELCCQVDSKMTHANRATPPSSTATKKRMNIMRKVKSFNSVNLSEELQNMNSKGSFRSFQQKKASRFSSAAQRARFSYLPITPEGTVTMLPSTSNLNYSSHSHKASHSSLAALHDAHVTMSRSSSVLSFGAMEGSEHEEVPGPMATLTQLVSGQFRSLQLTQMLHLAFFLALFLGSIVTPNLRGDSSATSRLYTSNKHEKERQGMLGSAMISSVTEYLSPILPFAGGVDLRRNENWEGFLLKNNNNEREQTRLSKIVSMPRGGARSRKQIRKSSDYPMTLSATTPFLSTKEIEEMTLREIAVTFRYAIEAGREDFDLDTFLSQNYGDLPLNERMVKAVRSIETAVVKSRGDGVLSARTQININLDEVTDLNGPLSDNGFGDVDALRFCGAMRILAEWRMLRQVPAGYKQYAVGMNLGHKDVVQNIAKIEAAVHEWIASKSDEEAEIAAINITNEQRQACVESGRSVEQCTAEIEDTEIPIQRRSPTLKQLLQYEADFNIHSKLPRLKDKTAAMGLLWVRRQLHYQTTIFDNIISVPETFSTTIDAVSSAYDDVYGDIHGWTVQKIFNYSFQSAPTTDIIFRHMNPHRLLEVTRDTKNVRNTRISNTNSSRRATEPSLSEHIVIYPDNSDTSQLFTSDNASHKGNPILNFFDNIGTEWDKLGRHVESELDKLGHHIGSEWEKTVCDVSNLLDQKRDVDCEELKQSKKAKIKQQSETKSSEARQGATLDHSKGIHISEKEMDEIISREMRDDAKEHILVYLNSARPIVKDLEGLFEEMNMDDPTKV